MDVADDADGSLDPRIQIELENLNNATGDINKLETELDEAHTAFRQLLSEATRRLKEIADKLGSSCIEKARCYYEALEVARRAQVQCQQQAQMFQRASIIHAAAKETVSIAEARFMSHQHEWNFDQAWQDMLNQATIKVMDAENEKAECGREHHRRALLFHDAEKRLLQLEEQHKNSIMKARPYFEEKAHCDQMLSTQKERVECLQRAIKDAKKNYAASLRTLEQISNQIHQQRSDNDFVANGPREPGVGAELVSPDKSVNYELEFNQLNANRRNSGSNGQPKIECRTQDYDNACGTKEDAEHLGKRSVDGSEATSSQWELELQASMDNLNNLSLETSTYDDDRESTMTTDLHIHGKEKKASSSDGMNCSQGSISSVSQSTESPVHTLSHLKKLSKNFQILKKPLISSSILSHSQRLHSVINEVAESVTLNKSKFVLKNYASKSLNSSPVNKSACSVEGIECTEKYQRTDNGSITNDTEDDKTDKEVAQSLCINETCTMEEISKNDLNAIININSARSNVNNNTTLPQSHTEGVPLNRRPKSNTSQVASRSAGSTPVKLKSSLTLPTTKPLDKKIADSVNRNAVLRALTNSTSSIKELPLLSIFEKNGNLTDSKGKSSSMINLDDKQSLTILLDNSHLDNIQTVSAERLASARDNLFRKAPR